MRGEESNRARVLRNLTACLLAAAEPAARDSSLEGDEQDLMRAMRRGLPACGPRAAHVRACFHYSINLDADDDAEEQIPRCVCVSVTHVSGLEEV